MTHLKQTTYTQPYRNNNNDNNNNNVIRKLCRNIPRKIIVEEIIRRMICSVTAFDFLMRPAVNKEGFYTGANIGYVERISSTKACFDLQSLDLNQEFDVGKVHVTANNTFISNGILK
jgi:hypothetical protein